MVVSGTWAAAGHPTLVLRSEDCPTPYRPPLAPCPCPCLALELQIGEVGAYLYDYAVLFWDMHASTSSRSSVSHSI
jgi:hypothetical protein